MRARKHNKQWHSLVVYFFSHIKPLQMPITWILSQITTKTFSVAIIDIFKMWTTRCTVLPCIPCLAVNSPPVTTNKLKSTGKYKRIHRSQWLCSSKRRSDCLIAAIAGQILLRAWMFVSCTYCVLHRQWPLQWTDHLFTSPTRCVCVFVI
jgi:hypothetical protein